MDVNKLAIAWVTASAVRSDRGCDKGICPQWERHEMGRVGQGLEIYGDRFCIRMLTFLQPPQLRSTLFFFSPAQMLTTVRYWKKKCPSQYNYYFLNPQPSLNAHLAWDLWELACDSGCWHDCQTLSRCRRVGQLSAMAGCKWLMRIRLTCLPPRYSLLHAALSQTTDNKLTASKQFPLLVDFLRKRMYLWFNASRMKDELAQNEILPSGKTNAKRKRLNWRLYYSEPSQHNCNTLYVLRPCSDWCLEHPVSPRVTGDGCSGQAVWRWWMSRFSSLIALPPRRLCISTFDLFRFFHHQHPISNYPWHRKLGDN